MSEEKIDALINDLQRAHEEIAALQSRLNLFAKRGPADSVRGWIGVGVVCITGLFWLFNIHSELEHHIEEEYHRGAKGLNDTLIEVRTNQVRIMQDIEQIKKGLQTK